MRTIMRLSLCLLVGSFFVTSAAAGVGPTDSLERHAPESNGAVSASNGSECLRMTVAASDMPSLGGQARQHYRIYFENHCESVRVVYWCAEHPSQSLSATSVCAPRPSAQVGVAAPLYAVVRKREFQWTFPQGTRIRFVDCNDSTYPTSDFRCASPGKQGR
jgi:hypothetical protein